MEKSFEESELNLCEYQYCVTHTETASFKEGDKVFLKSNPEHPLDVASIKEKSIIVRYVDKEGVLDFLELPPQCILHYKDAADVIYKGKFKFNLN